MLDFREGEELHFVCYVNNKPDVVRVRFVRPSTARPRSRHTLWLVAANDKGTEIACPLKYIYKWVDDAQDKAQEMAGGRA